MLSRPENVVYFFRQVVGVPSVTKEVLRKERMIIQRWVEAPTHCIRASPSNGPRRKSAKKTRWPFPQADGTSQPIRRLLHLSGAWNRDLPFVAPFPKFPTKDPILPCYGRPGTALPITTFTFEIPNWALWS